MLHVSSALTSQIILVNENGSIVLANNDLDRILAKSSHTRYGIVTRVTLLLTHNSLSFLVLVLSYGPRFSSPLILMHALAAYPTRLSQSIPPSFSLSTLIATIRIATLSISFIATWKEEVSIQWLKLILRSRYVMVMMMGGGRFDFNGWYIHIGKTCCIHIRSYRWSHYSVR